MKNVRSTILSQQILGGKLLEVGKRMILVTIPNYNQRTT